MLQGVARGCSRGTGGEEKERRRSKRIKSENRSQRFGKKVTALGDWNARLHGRRAGEEDTIGDYMFGRGVKYLEKRTNDREVLNRDLLVTLARNSVRNMVPMRLLVGADQMFERLVCQVSNLLSEKA